MNYVFIDIDGTLIGNFSHAIPASAKKAITLARENGHKLFVCTGRPLNAINHFDLSLFDGVVCSAGGYVKIDQEVIFEQVMSEEELSSIMHVLDTYKTGYFLEGKQANYFKVEHQTYLHDLFKNYDEQSKWEDVQEMMRLLDMEKAKADDIYKIAFPIKDRDILKQIIEELSDKFQVVYTDRDEGSVVEAEIMIKGCNKASGAKKVVEHFGATLDDAIAFGDSMNDYEIIQECGVGVAMGNACDELKKVANHITDTVFDDGLYKGFSYCDLI